MYKITNLIIVAALLSGILLVSCNAPSRSGDQDPDNGYLGMEVPRNFDFKTTSSSQLNLTAHDITSSSTVVEIYNENPNKGKGKLIRKLFLPNGGSHSLSLNLPTHLNYVWVVSRQTDGVIVTHKVPLSGGSLSLEVGEIGPMTLSAVQPGGAISEPFDCDSGCDNVISGSGNVSISSGESYCIQQGDTFSGNLTFSGQGGVLQICGTAQFSNVNVNGNPGLLEMHISETGLLQTSNLNLNSSNALVSNRGQMQVSNGLAFNYRFENFSDITLHPFNVNNNGEFYNEGHLTVPGNFNNNNKTWNYGTITADQQFHNNGQATLLNACKIVAVQSFHQNGDMLNEGYIETEGTTYIQQGGNRISEMGSQSLIQTDKMVINQELKGQQSGQYARVNVVSELRLNGGGSVTGLIDLCIENDNLINNGSISNTIIFCEAYIPENECVPGAGTGPGNGGGGDGPPPGGDDDFPDDPDRTFKNPYPADGVFGTLAYEDLWPSYGDFDMNDLVLGYNMVEITNDDNEVVDIEFTMVIRAIGAMLESGFGVEFPMSPSRIQSVDGARYTKGLVNTNSNGTEAGQDNAVVILWDDSALNMGLYTNTENPSNHVPEDTIVVTVTFDPPVSKSELGDAPYKPFIFVNEERSHEIHLPGNAPTSLADESLFGTHDDDSSPSEGRFYVSNNNLNWAINIPETIPYPREQIEILDAYLRFRAWAESGGQEYPDWYLDLPGYRVNSNLYFRP